MERVKITVVNFLYCVVIQHDLEKECNDFKMYIVNPKETIKTMAKNIANKPMVEITQHYKKQSIQEKSKTKKKQRIDMKNRKQIAR